MDPLSTTLVITGGVALCRAVASQAETRRLRALADLTRALGALPADMKIIFIGCGCHGWIAQVPALLDASGTAPLTGDDEDHNG